jgi:hypothetical protein
LVHADEGDAGLALKVLGHEQHLTDGGGGEVGYMELVGGTGHQVFTEDFHCGLFFI